jgi:signal transduction histidine kinase
MEQSTPTMTSRTLTAIISHDLRTPITRLRLRCEFIEDDVHRMRMLADLDQMRSMLEAVLSFGPTVVLKIASSLQPTTCTAASPT